MSQSLSASAEPLRRINVRLLCQERDRLGPALHIELAIHAVEVGLDRPLADIANLGDLAVRGALQDMTEHVHLSAREGLELRHVDCNRSGRSI